MERFSYVRLRGSQDITCAQKRMFIGFLAKIVLNREVNLDYFFDIIKSLFLYTHCAYICRLIILKYDTIPFITSTNIFQVYLTFTRTHRIHKSILFQYLKKTFKYVHIYKCSNFLNDVLFLYCWTIFTQFYKFNSIND